MLTPIMKSPSCGGLLVQNRFYVQVLAWTEEKILFFMGLKLCVELTSLLILWYISQSMRYIFSRIIEEDKKLEKEGCLMRVCKSIASLCDLESPSPYQMTSD